MRKRNNHFEWELLYQYSTKCCIFATKCTIYSTLEIQMGWNDSFSPQRGKVWKLIYWRKKEKEVVFIETAKNKYKFQIIYQFSFCFRENILIKMGEMLHFDQLFLRKIQLNNYLFANIVFCLGALVKTLNRERECKKWLWQNKLWMFISWKMCCRTKN